MDLDNIRKLERVRVYLDYLRARRLDHSTYLKASQSAVNIIMNDLYLFSRYNKNRKTSIVPNQMFDWESTPEGYNWWMNIHRTPLR